ncbi:hypothetical protein ACIPF8_18915 [Collimonas sp. NPDC087041]|uniref:hypothetical protein n=1 Tax=Collimonas sp. NPDC087041 TaxID=3363960 RepID=UPI003800A048
MTYKLSLLDGYVTKVDSNQTIPFADGNAEYAQYLEWLSEGNTPEPADVPIVASNTIILAKISEIEQTLQPRATREYFLNGDKTRLQEIENQITALRAQLI